MQTINDKSKTSFEAKFVAKYGAKKQMLQNIEKYWAEINLHQETDNFSKAMRENVINLMECKPFNADNFYKKKIKQFRETTKDYSFTVF